MELHEVGAQRHEVRAGEQHEICAVQRVGTARQHVTHQDLVTTGSSSAEMVNVLMDTSCVMVFLIVVMEATKLGLIAKVSLYS